jgi:hypothetical protein
MSYRLFRSVVCYQFADLSELVAAATAQRPRNHHFVPVAMKYHLVNVGVFNLRLITYILHFYVVNYSRKISILIEQWA